MKHGHHGIENIADSRLFPVIDRHVWLNHAAISPWPQPVIDAAGRFVADNAGHGPLNYHCWLQTETRLRERLARLLRVSDSSDIALLKNTSEGLSLVAAGLDWRPGDNVVHAAGDFPSNVLPWQALGGHGVEVRAADLDCADPETALIDLLDARTRVMSVSAVSYDTGLRLDLARLGAACRERGVLLCVDAIQQFGALPLDPGRDGIDFLVAGSHKWLLAPEGMAVFWSRPQARDRLQACQHGWRMYDRPFDFDRDDWRVPRHARRFEPGTLNSFAIHALDAACGLLLDHDPQAAGEAILARSGWLCRALESIDDVRVITPAQAARRAGIVSFTHARIPAVKLVEDLAEAGIHAALRGSMVRFSPHFYTPVEQLEAAVARVAGAAG